ncbi:MAG: carbamoyltransferase HypF [Gammaproteobacteria bacterium]|nr:carbamoyltransferase HypF [Gammaproteobacteria bacterium]
MLHVSTDPPDQRSAIAARQWTLAGRVQGVGFRPFVYRLAHALGVNGWVRNRLGEVEIFAEARRDLLDRFAAALISEAPPLAQPRIAATYETSPCGLNAFEIRESAATEKPCIHVPPDYFACTDCLREVDDPRDRRFGYPFTNCTQCGPRYTLIERLPYDRPNTSMAGFPLCPDCAREYGDPLDRRFHAEPVACPACGPRLSFAGGETPVEDNAGALAAAIRALRTGHIVAVKGVGGYHLACDAGDAAAVARLRARKPRPAKPLAIMFPDLDALTHCVELRADEQELVCGPMRPIVLARRRTPSVLAAGIAPDLDEIGVLLPYTPLHHLLCRAFAAPLVMTSGNLSGEPVLTDNIEAQARLAPIAEAFLHHDRPIVRPADDPVFRTIAGRPRPLRLGRGCAPLEMQLPCALAEPVLAVGGHLKLTVCLAWDDRAVISPHIGDMGTPRSVKVFEQVAADLQRLYGVRAARIVHDAHPGYTTTRWAQAQALACTPVWHHHAHASALAGEIDADGGGDAGWLVFAWDGTGYGEDGTLWGGETLCGRPGDWRRVARLRPFRLPGGDKAGREPWRSAAALCWETGAPFTVPQADGELLHQAWERGINAPQSSAAGRLFDAAASLTGVLQTGSFEGQGPMYLEALAAGADGTPAELPLVRADDGLWQTDWAPLLAQLRDPALPVARRAADFHASLARAIRRQTERLARDHAFTRVGLTGGVFQNALLAGLAVAELRAAGFRVELPERIPCNDAGISFGQVIETLYSAAK